MRGQAGGRGQRRAQRQHKGRGASQVTTGEWEGPAEEAELPVAAGPPGQLADGTVLLQACSLQSVVGHIFPLSTPQLAQHGVGQN